ncbi:MAG: DNA methyltransferase, partial [Tunicatimonas sp.]
MFVQIGDDNVHRVRTLMDEIFGQDSFTSMIAFTKGATGLSASGRMPARLDYILWYAKSPENIVKYRQLFTIKSILEDDNFPWVIFPNGEVIRKSLAEKENIEIPKGSRYGQDVSLTKPGPGAKYTIEYSGKTFDSGKRWWGTSKDLLERALKTDRVITIGNSLRHLRYLDESSTTAIGNLWGGFLGQSSPVYVVQTNTDIVKRCLLMATDPGDLVLDPTCGSGTTAYVAEQWGRRWITIDTSRVALALARARIMGARYPYYLLADSKEGQLKEAEITRMALKQTPTAGSVQQGFVYERVPHVLFKDISNNTEVDVIWEQFQEKLEPLREQLNKLLETSWEEWEIPREAKDDWSDEAKATHEQWWKQRIARQKELDASIAAKAEQEFLYDKPYEDKKKVRVAGPFTVESISPHRTLGMDENDELLDGLAEDKAGYGQEQSFTEMILENLKTAGVQQAHKENKINFSLLTPWPGRYVGAEGKYTKGTDENAPEKRAAIFIGPEFGTVPRPDLVAAAREAGDAGFDVLIACAFNYDAHSSEFEKLGRIPVLKARMNADLHMAGDLKNTGKGNLFVIFGEPDIDVLEADSD